MGFNVIIASTSWAALQKINSGEDLAVFFHATSCGHCHEAREVLNKILGEIPVSVYGINVGVDQALAIQVGAEATPTLVLFSGGTVAGKLEGSQDAETYLRFLSSGEGGDEGEEAEDGEPVEDAKS